MAINAIPFDANRTPSESNATPKSRQVEQSTDVSRVENTLQSQPLSRQAKAKRTRNKTRQESGKSSFMENTETNGSMVSKPNRRKKRTSKQADQQDDFGLYTNRQTADHHLVQEPIDDDEHDIDITV